MKHLAENNETYFSHLKFASKVGATLIIRGVIFIIHGFLPVCSIPKSLNLEDTHNKLKEWNAHAETRK